MPCKSELIVEVNPACLAMTAADIFATTARDFVAGEERFVVALSGGSTPRAMHRLLAEEPYRSGIPWPKTHMFWVDERCVPENSPASNYGGARRDFLDQIPVPPGQIHRMPGEISPEQGAVQYETELKGFFRLTEGDFPVFDLILLGIGKDGHTASLFPGKDVLDEGKKLVMAVKGGNPDVSRLTMTFPVLNRAGHIVFLVSGRDKASILKTVFENEEAGFPVQRIHPLSGRLTWLLDREAASLLSTDIGYM
jgi:6-phosphogluconolactonase